MTPFDCEVVRTGWPAQPINTVSAAAFVAVGLWMWRRGRPAPAAFAAAAGLGSVWFHAAPGDAATWAHDLTFYALALASVFEVKRLLAARRPPLLAAAIFSAGLAVWFFSRTDGALCAPGSTIQGHAVWHIAAAAAVAVLFGAGRIRSDSNH